jgi:DNA polymerase elongation subunit (family B)
MSWEPRQTDFSTEKDLIFQTLDWYCEDFENDETGYLEYKIFVFGIDNNRSPVTLRVDSFFPFFYIELPESFHSGYVSTVREALGMKSIKNIEYLKAKKYYGFENNKLRNFLKLTFYSSKAMRTARYRIDKATYSIPGLKEPCSFQLYESNIDPVLRFTHIQDILTAGWVHIKQGKYTLSDSGEFFTTKSNCVKNYQENVNKISNVRILYFDIEACSEDGSFPNALKPNDRVTQICCILKDQITSKTDKFLFNLGTCGSIEGTTVITSNTEKELLVTYSKFIKETDPDVIVGYNIFGFDNGFLFERAKVLKIESQFSYQSKINTYRTQIEKKILNNQQSGFNDWKMTRLIGRTHIDLLQVIKKDFKLESYKLNSVGEHFLKEGKDDVSPKEIFEAWDPVHGSTEKRTRVGKYCVQDTNLCLLLFEKFAVLPNYLEMAKVTRVPLEYLVTRGQSIKVFSQIAYETRKNNYLIPVLPREESEGKFQGATVLEAKTGYYTRPVCGLDFASLYPSIMIAHNMCYSTVVLEKKYLDLPGFEYSTVKCNEDLSVTFVQNQNGVLSGILQSLWKNRKVTKKEMNAATDPFMKTVLNAKQLAIKVSMNSIYGFTGAVVGALPCLEISQAVTGCGRQMIEQTQKHAVEMFQCEIVYGDSVSADTPVLIRENGKILPVEIKDLFEMNNCAPFPQFKPGEAGLSEKEHSVPETNIEVWTASGWSPLKRTIRHRCNKKMYRVLTHTGLVDVTEDHSLLSKDLVQLKPGDVDVGTELFHSYPVTCEKNTFKLKDIIDIFKNLNQVPEKYRLTFIQGFFVGDGSCGKYNCPSGKKYSWALNNTDIHILQIFVEWLDTFYDGISFKILDTIESSGVYKLVPVGNIKQMVEEYSVFYSNGCKIITSDILNSELENQKWFFYGYYLADGYKCYNECTQNMKITTKNKLSASHYYLLARNIGFKVSINDRSDKLNVFTLTISSQLIKNENEIKKIRYLGPTEDYVYDLETEDGTFQAGIGQMIVKNTDSCYVIFPQPVNPDGTLTTLFKVAENAAKKISETFRKPIELEFEKFMYPLILVAKKRYMYLEWTDPKKHNGEIEAKGVELVRRDNCPYVKETLDKVLSPIMFKNNVQLGRSEAEKCIDSLLRGEVPIKKLILSKNLRSDYKGFEKIFEKNQDGSRSEKYRWERTKEETVKENGKNVKTGKMIKSEDTPAMAHVALVEKMRERDINSAPKPGDRVPFVYIDIGDPKALAAKKVEDPHYVIENNLPIDTLYYLEHQLKNPLKTIFDILLSESECEKMFQRESMVEAKRKEKIAASDAKRKNEKNKDIRSFFTVKV